MPVTAQLISSVQIYVEAYMSHFDGSHDYSHIERVVAVAHAIYAELSLPSLFAAQSTSPSSFTPVPAPLDRTLITLCALLHDVGDRKYLKPGEDTNTMVRNLLLNLGAEEELADKVQIICAAVSYTNELKDESYVRELVERYPELAVVQDADRLDSIGAIGIGRVFSYGGAKADRCMAPSISHFRERLLKVERLMKTSPGKRMAAERTEKLETFLGWWNAEMEVVKGGITWM